MEWGIKGKVIERARMRDYTSIRVGGEVPYLIYPSDTSDLLRVFEILKREGISWRILGNGTNVIVSDRGLNEAILRLTRINHFRVKRTGDEVKVEVSSGYPLRKLIERLVGRGIKGLERLYSIPGTVGGAIKMNAGSFGSSISERLKWVEVLKEGSERVRIEKNEMEFGYRKSPFSSRDCIVCAELELEHGDKESLQREIRTFYEERISRHPMDLPSAGSIFKAVGGVPAWKFIERAGLKGLRIGDACISEKHANFIVNLGNAKAHEIKSLIDKVKEEVLKREGVLLEEEVELWGFDE